MSSAQSLAISLRLPLLFNLSVFFSLKIIGRGWGVGGCVFQGAPPPSTDVIHYWYKGEGGEGDRSVDGDGRLVLQLMVDKDGKIVVNENRCLCGGGSSMLD